jgi:hypothetical protein
MLISSWFCCCCCGVSGGRPQGSCSRAPSPRSRRAVHLAAGPRKGDVQSLLHPVLGSKQKWVQASLGGPATFPSTAHLQQIVWWACRSPSQVLLGLEGGQAEEVAEHFLLLCQVVGGLHGEAGLEVGGLGSVDEATVLSRSWMLLVLRALIHSLLFDDYQPKSDDSMQECSHIRRIGDGQCLAVWFGCSCAYI